MAITILQTPLYRTHPASQETIYTVEQPTIVLNETQVKFIASVYVSREIIGAFNSPTNLVATLKTSPNNAGVGMFDLRPVLESYVKPQHLGREFALPCVTAAGSGSQFKGQNFNDEDPHHIHLIDQFCTNKDNITYYLIEFNVEYLNTTTEIVEVDPAEKTIGEINLVWNGVLANEDPLTLGRFGAFGFNLDDTTGGCGSYENGSGNYIMSGVGECLGRFLTNQPLVQNITENDYHTFAFFNCFDETYGFKTAEGQPNNNIVSRKTIFYNSSGVQIGSSTLGNSHANGGANTLCPTLECSSFIIYTGVGPANIKGQAAIPAGTSYYTVHMEGLEEEQISYTYRFNLIDEACRGYEPIRLAWLNRLGAWDYFTFNLKTTRKSKVKRRNYTQLSGTWNEKYYRPYDHLGGQKVYKIQSTESLSLNSDYINEETANWLKELFESPDVYIVNKFSSNTPVPTGTARYIHKYIEPVIIKTSSYVKKTRANDGLIQYKLEIEKGKQSNIQTA